MPATEVASSFGQPTPLVTCDPAPTWATMTKRGKKRIGKKHVDTPQDGGVGGANGIPVAHPERGSQPVSRQELGLSRVNLTFYRSSAQLYGELHQRLGRFNMEEFTEASVLQTGRQVLRALDDLAEAADPRSDPKGSCPFVMLLSMLLPTLRKYLSWTQATRSVWNSYPAALRLQSTSSDIALYKSEADTVLWAMLAQHDMLTRFSLQVARILRFIVINAGVDHDGSLPRLHVHHSKPSGPASHASSGSSSASSAASTPREPVGIGSIPNTPQPAEAKRFLIPQVHHISVELANVHAECKIHLAELAECLVEKSEMIAKHLCTPMTSKEAPRSRISAREFVERLVSHLLEPLGQRMVAEPSPSYTNLFPRIMEQCITVTIDNFGRSNGKRNELQAGPFGAAATLLRTWSSKLEIEYNTLVRYLGNNNHNNELSADTDAANSFAVSHANNRLNLVNLSGFKRLDTTLNSWLNNSSNGGIGPDPGSGNSARSWGVANIAGGIRNTLVRTFSGRATMGGPPAQQI